MMKYLKSHSMIKNKLPKYAEKKVISPEDLPSFIKKLKDSGKTIATLNGSFDLLHAGHLQIIYEASKQSEILLVALNSDFSIKQYKGQDRPIIELLHRLSIIAALEFVDFVTWFEETTPCDLLERVRPDIHVNGAEYGCDCIESSVVKKYGGKIHIVDLVPGLSTSDIIKKIITTSCV